MQIRSIHDNFPGLFRGNTTILSTVMNTKSSPRTYFIVGRNSLARAVASCSRGKNLIAQCKKDPPGVQIRSTLA